MKNVGWAFGLAFLLGLVGFVNATGDSAVVVESSVFYKDGNPVAGAVVVVSSPIAIASGVTNEAGQTSIRIPAEPNSSILVRVFFGGGLVGTHDLSIGEPPFGTLKTGDTLEIISP